MSKIYTIGFTQKTAEEFFKILEYHKIKNIYDVRLNNSTQLSGFTKAKDLEFFLKKILNVGYIHDLRFSPTKDLLNKYKKKNITWEQYETEFKSLLDNRNLKEYIDSELSKKIDGLCFLCSEVTAEKCHRRLVAEYIKDILIDEKIEIIHV